MERELLFIVLAFACLLHCSKTDSQSTETTYFEASALYALKADLNPTPSQLADWNIVPNPCNWSNVMCDPNFQVISVNLSNMGFSGFLSNEIGTLTTLTTLSLQGNDITGNIPEEIGNLTGLIRLELEHNHFTGEIPSSLSNLNHLKYLFLNNNNLSGTIPDSLSELTNLHSLQLSSNQLSGQVPERLFQIPQYNFTGNKLNCGGDRCPLDNSNIDSSNRTKVGDIDSSKKVGVIVGVVGGTFGVLLIGVLVFCGCMSRYTGFKSEVYADVPGEVDCGIAFGQLTRFAYRELQIAKDNFSEHNVVGQGGFSKVYKGVLVDDTKVVVKRLTDYERPGGDTAFLQLKPGEVVLDWPTRKRISLGTALGLEYLHEHCNPKIIHRDVKAANVLLDQDFEAVVGDFGLAKLVDARKTNVTTQVRGTMGHIAPEYLSTGKSSERTDVFGYGITLLELVTSQRAIDLSRLEEELLLDHVKKLEREKRLDDIVDLNLNKKYDIQEVEMMIKVALLCTQAFPEDRPTMSEVVRMLEGEGLTERWEDWQNVEVTRRQEYERHSRAVRWQMPHIHSQDADAFELSAGR